MSSWTYVAIAYTVVWGALALYALALARRVSQARAVARSLQEAARREPAVVEQDAVICDAPPAP